MKLVFATHNQHKFKEVQALVPKHVELLSLKDINCYDEIPETEDTIEGNAALKAAFVREQYHLACFADDTGLEVNALGGAPGVYSARYSGPEGDSQSNMAKLLTNLNGKADRTARFKTVIVLSLPTTEKAFTGICEGTILSEPKGEKGFGYDPIFQPAGYDKTFAEMNSVEKGRISHRGKAIRQLIIYLEAQS